MRLLPERAYEWFLTVPDNHPLRKCGAFSRPYFSEQDARRDFAAWRRITLWRRRVWRWSWRLVEAKGDWE